MTASPTARRRSAAADLGMLLVALIWGINFSVTKGVFPRFPPLAFTAVRFAIASLLLWPLARWVEGNVPLPRGTLTRLIVLGVVGNTLLPAVLHPGTGADHRVEQRPHPGLDALGRGAVSAALGFEPIRPRVLGGVLVATLGVVLVVAARGEGFGRGA